MSPLRNEVDAGRKTSSTTWMADRDGRRVPFDERAALEELERVREQIERSRAERRALQDEFSQWVRSFKRPVEPTGAEPSEETPAAIDTPAVIVVSAGPKAQETGEQDAPASLGDPVATAAHPAAPELPPHGPLAQAGPRRAISRSTVIVGGGLILLVGGAMATWMLRSEAPPSPGQESQARPASPPAEQAPSPPPAAAAAEPASQGSELVTIRRVWIRVLVDGERVLEREVPADTRVPLRAQKTIVIRTGDAGAVRLSLVGEDQGFLGREGEVVTRTFTVPPR
jgi:hypothetical protein